MNAQPFDPFEPLDHAAEPQSSISVPFFDRAGLAWIAACVAIAVAAGHWIPPLAEPGALGGVAQATSPATAASAASVVTRAAKPVPQAQPLQVAGEKGRPAKAVGQLQLGMF